MTLHSWHPNAGGIYHVIVRLSLGSDLKHTRQLIVCSDGGEMSTMRSANNCQVAESMSTWRWQTQIVGVQSDLQFLALHFLSGNVRIFDSERRDGFLIEADAFDSLARAEDVVAKAAELLQILSGVLQIERGVLHPLRTGAVIKKHDDGKEDVFAFFHETLNVRAEVGAVVVYAGDSTGTPVAVPQPRLTSVQAVDLALRDPVMAKALRLLGQGAKTWVDMYRLYEVLEGDLGGQHKTQSLSWISEVDLKRFKHSANSVSVGGDAARHGRELQQPPTSPMSLVEAESFVMHLLANWVEQKLQNAP